MAISIKGSVVAAVGTSSAPQQQPPPHPQAAVSISAASGIVSSMSFFSKDLNPVPYMCLLPGPGEPFETTRQLAHGIALLQDSIQEDSLSPDTRNGDTAP